MGQSIYMAVTNDEYELPVYIEDTLKGLSAKLGRRHDSVASCFYRRYVCRDSDGEKFLIRKVEE